MADDRTTPVTPRERRLANAVHLYTASGLVPAFLAAAEIVSASPDPRMVFLWLAIAVVIDATDGPFARKFEVKRTAPAIDGRKIDDIIDYLTFTFLPLVFIARMGWVPEPAALYVIPPMIASVFGFANAGAKDEEAGFFLGFPSYWNIVAFYAGLLFAYSGPWPNGVLLLLLAILTVAPVGFIYPNLAPRRLRPAILGGAILWTLLVIAMMPRYPDVPQWLIALSLVYPFFYTVVSIREFRRVRRRRRAGDGSEEREAD